jgi:hypothetical protein
MSFSFVHALGIGELNRRALAPGRYLTDGTRLFRVVSRFEGDGEVVLVGLEDCSTFEVRALLPRELRAMGLRAVRVAPVIETVSEDVSLGREPALPCP